jgi:hypothetical protein
MNSLDDLEDLFEDLSIDGPSETQLFEMYGRYLNDIVKNPIVINGIKLAFNKNPSKHPICKGKHQCFEHIVTRESKHSKIRNFDPDRANKIHWIRPILENINDSRIKYFEAINDNGENQQFYWYEEKMYIIIIREIKANLLLITSFSVDKEERYNYKKKYENFREKQKKTPLRE